MKKTKRKKMSSLFYFSGTLCLLMILASPCFPDYFSSQKNYLDSRLDTASKQQKAAIQDKAKSASNYR